MKIKKMLLIIGLICALVVTPVLTTGCCIHEHSFSNWVQVEEPTCTEKGLMKRECKCGFYETTDIAALGHAYGEFKKTKDPTCTEDGEQEKECSRCHDKQKALIEKYGHNYSQKWESSATEHFHICTRCREREESSVQAHDFTLNNNLKCSICGYEKTTDSLVYVKNADNQSYSVKYVGDITKIPYEIEIPDEYGGLPVTEIADYAFSTQYNNIESPLSKITLGKNIKRIGVSAFWHNTNLTDFVLPENLEVIDNYAFSQCSHLNNLILNEKLKRIEQQAFYSCTGLSNIQFNEKLESIGESAFFECGALENLEFSTELKSIGRWSFYENTSLKTIKFKDNFEHLGFAAFYHCTDLTDADLGNGNLVIDSWAFQDCTSLQNLYVSDNTQEIGEGILYGVSTVKFNNKDYVDYLGNKTNPYIIAFKADTEIQTYTASPETRVIADNAFYNCTQLTTATLENVYSIGINGFRFCSSLETLTFGSNIKKICAYSFEDCTSLSQVNIPSIKDWLEIDFSVEGEQDNPDAFAYKGQVNPLYYTADLMVEGRAVTELTIPDEVTKIYPYAFAGYDKLESIKFGKNVSEIGKFAFRECKNVQTITLDGENSTFYVEENCIIDTSTKTIVVGCAGSTIPQGVKKVGDYVFFDIQLNAQNIIIPDSVEEIGRFSFSGATGFYPTEQSKEITMGMGVKKIGYWAFANFKTSKLNIQNLEKWCEIDFDGDGANPMRREMQLFVEGKEIDDTHSYTPYYALEFTSNIHEIKPWAFKECRVQKIIIPKEVTKIDSSSFARTQSLNEIVLDEQNPNYKLTANKQGIVDKQTNTLILCLRNTGSVDFSQEDFEKVAPYVCWARTVKSLVLPSTVTEIGEYAFSQSGLTSLTLGEGLVKICDNAFSGNGDLTEITIPASVNYIGEQAFTSSDQDKPGLLTAHFDDPTGWFATEFTQEPHLSVDFSDPTFAAQELRKNVCFWEKED